MNKNSGVVFYINNPVHTYYVSHIFFSMGGKQTLEIIKESHKSFTIGINQYVRDTIYLFDSEILKTCVDLCIILFNIKSGLQ